jgi:hypothetical protein
MAAIVGEAAADGAGTGVERVIGKGGAEEVSALSFFRRMDPKTRMELPPSDFFFPVGRLCGASSFFASGACSPE